MQVLLGSSHMGGTSLEAENDNEHYKHTVADDHTVACHTLCWTWTRCHTPQLVPGVCKLYSQAYPQRANKAGVYLRKYGTYKSQPLYDQVQTQAPVTCTPQLATDQMHTCICF